MPSLKHIQVLVVDDNPHMRAITASVLRSVGVGKIWEASDGAEALTALREHAIDLAFIDFEMKPMTGLEFTHAVRTHPDSANPYLPIIMLTGYTQEFRVIEARDMGVTEFLAKPISAKALVDRLNAVIFNARPFIKSSGFFGPDRRRLGDRSYRGVPRRTNDQAGEVSAT